jgi:eukaryotic-like serine/threonine-protein kinase
MGTCMLGRIFLGRYEAVRLLGEGGMGRVYLARQLDLHRQVVIKVMHDHIAADPKFQERFQRETLLMARFQHPYAVTLYDASLNDPQGPCIVMEYIRGVTLEQMLTKNVRFSPPRIARLLDQLCEVLQAAHTEGIVHRDLKPANLMVVDPETPYEKLKVMDFGLATLIDVNSLKKMTDTSTEFAVGTPGYMAPEQIRGEDMDHRGDLYSVGVILYELMTGKLPFSDRSSMDILLAHATEEPPWFAEMGAADWVPAPVEAVVRSCLAKDPAQRPAGARELADRYFQALEQASTAAPPAKTPVETPAAKPQDAALPEPKTDDNTVVHELVAWMPQAIAIYKVTGFVHDAGGEVIESVPGRIRVRLGDSGNAGRGPLRWLGLGRRFGAIEIDLYLKQAPGQRQNELRILVAMRPANSGARVDAAWRARCNDIFCDLRSYLLATSGALTEAAAN